MLIGSRRVLINDELICATVSVEGDRIVSLAPGIDQAAWHWGNLLLLPGMVDLHGDAFERQWMPRPGVFFPVEAALHETDRQLLANGITTAYHGLTVSWEPGLRSVQHGRLLVDALRRLRADLSCDTRLHLRYEIHALDQLEEVIAWIDAGGVDLIAFNDHLAMIDGHLGKEAKAGKYAERSGITVDAFRAILASVQKRSAEVPAAVARVAAAGRARGIPMASHDDETPAMRASYHALGAGICEFPIDAQTASAARACGSEVVMGAPNVVRGGSHTQRMTAIDAIRADLCTVLASDYYYPAMLHAAFRLTHEDATTLPEAWNLVAANPARAAGLADRGRIDSGWRADFIAVDDTDPAHPRVAATVAGGRVVYCSEPALMGTLHELVGC